eukprot:CAMPEP_0206436646 /NCGR_PEP_ID=MMETSP0324_2-20121206/10600_1 /ASSEMBLY_ACC=CAM_ASM_000836 /TAXON_ID=2866 /ORGANISM="Crypthecodinium cohnii, Strain Seligo" /LENGTH=129 /DNA_ID=CAMNT_0053903837 /DNA_START=93 /DNA_END=482 /DNA_ORIENTATION=-
MAEMPYTRFPKLGQRAWIVSHALCQNLWRNPESDPILIHFMCFCRWPQAPEASTSMSATDSDGQPELDGNFFPQEPHVESIEAIKLLRRMHKTFVHPKIRTDALAAGDVRLLQALPQEAALRRYFAAAW